MNATDEQTKLGICPECGKAKLVCQWLIYQECRFGANGRPNHLNDRDVGERQELEVICNNCGCWWPYHEAVSAGIVLDVEW